MPHCNAIRFTRIARNGKRKLENRKKRNEEAHTATKNGAKSSKQTVHFSDRISAPFGYLIFSYLNFSTLAFLNSWLSKYEISYFSFSVRCIVRAIWEMSLFVFELLGACALQTTLAISCDDALMHMLPIAKFALYGAQVFRYPRNRLDCSTFKYGLLFGSGAMFGFFALNRFKLHTSPWLTFSDFSGCLMQISGSFTPLIHSPPLVFYVFYCVCRKFRKRCNPRIYWDTGAIGKRKHNKKGVKARQKGSES